MSYLRTPLCI